VKGRKRHLLVDTQGLLLKALVLEADVQDRDAAKHLLMQNIARFPRLKRLWADGGYRGQFVTWARQVCGVTVDIVLRPDTGFVPLARRWVVERTFSWLGNSRRLSKDYEYFLSSSEAMLYVSSIRLMLRRLAASP